MGRNGIQRRRDPLEDLTSPDVALLELTKARADGPEGAVIVVAAVVVRLLTLIELGREPVTPLIGGGRWFSDLAVIQFPNSETQSVGLLNPGNESSFTTYTDWICHSGRKMFSRWPGEFSHPSSAGRGAPYLPSAM
jgi:hypothetical protein